jgi:hypothetical protein
VQDGDAAVLRGPASHPQRVSEAEDQSGVMLLRRMTSPHFCVSLCNSPEEFGACSTAAQRRPQADGERQTRAFLEQRGH